MNDVKMLSTERSKSGECNLTFKLHTSRTLLSQCVLVCVAVHSSVDSLERSLSSDGQIQYPYPCTEDSTDHQPMVLARSIIIDCVLMCYVRNFVGTKLT